MKIIIFDFEVFRYDTLLGTKIINEDNSIEYYQTWNLDEIKDFYCNNSHNFWVGHNNTAYDNLIMEAVMLNQDTYKKSKSIINSQFRPKTVLDFLNYDLMCCRSYSLKMTELLTGKAIYTTNVDFDIQRPLTEEEKLETEAYNRADLDQTHDNFLELYDIIELRLNILQEFNLEKKFLTGTEARLAALALGAKQIPGIENMLIKPKLYNELQIKNQAVIDYYLNEDFRKVAERKNKLTVTLCGVPHQLGSGGIHAAIKQCHETDMIYLDVSGYYNLVMLNYDLLPRTIPKEGKALYEYMYHEQLKLKGVNDKKRGVYKTILLAVFGASMNQYTDFYDPQVGSLITITGQLFLVDLLEKLEGKIKLIQSNTDGIIVKPLDTSSKEEVLKIVEDWCTRTHFVIKPKFIDELWQRDVNCYCYRQGEHLEHKGDTFVGNWAIERPVMNEHYNSKEAAIISKAVLNYLLLGDNIENTINSYKDNLLYFQVLAKKRSYSYMKFVKTFNDGKEIETDIDYVSRVFALKSDNYNGMVYKYKETNGKLSKVKVPNLADSVFVWNYEVLSKEAKASITSQIDFDYYINRAYEHIEEFINIRKIKGLNV